MLPRISSHVIYQPIILSLVALFAAINRNMIRLVRLLYTLPWLMPIAQSLSIPHATQKAGDDLWDQPWCLDSSSSLVDEKAVYVMSNTKPNSIIAMAAAGNDGSLSPYNTFTPTGGDGGNLANAVTGKPDQPDALSSSDSVVVAGDFIFNVNAGSNSVSMFSICPSDPMHPKLTGTPRSSNGVFPVSIAVSLAKQLVCVANTGVNAGIACANSSKDDGLGFFDTLRPFDVGQTQTPPIGPVPGVGDLIFNADESLLVVLAKGDGKEIPGFIETYDVVNGSVAHNGTQHHPPGLSAEFGSAIIPNTDDLILSAQADFGAVVLDLNDLDEQPMSKTNVSGQLASCWAQVATFTQTGFITDAAVNRLVETNLTTGDVVSEYYPPNSNPGMSDFRISGSMMWLLAAGNGTTNASVCVVEISGGPGSARQVQNYAIPGGSANVMGMAVYGRWRA